MKPDCDPQGRPAPARAPAKSKNGAPAPSSYAQRAALARQDMLALIHVAIFVVPVLGMLTLAVAKAIFWPLPLHAVASLVTFLIYRHDKQRARNKGWRIPEKTLHLGELLGGWPGALLAQRRFRHKTIKSRYRMVFWAIVCLHQVLWFDVLLSGRLHRLLIV